MRGGGGIRFLHGGQLREWGGHEVKEGKGNECGHFGFTESWVAPGRAGVIPDFYAKPCTHRMHDPGSIVPHIRSKVLTDNQMS
jgi:hypothetical protein